MRMTTWKPFLTFPDFETRDGFEPSIDVVQNADAFVLYAELPGMRKEDVTIEIEDGRLTLAGERTRPSGWEDAESHRWERTFGTFRRAFNLPRNVDAGAATARFEDGVLTLTLPKHETARTRRIEIEA